MDDQRFDRLSRALAGEGSRRGFLKAALVGLLGSVAVSKTASASQSNPNNADKSGPDTSNGCEAVCKNESATKESRIKCGCTGATTTTTTTTSTTTLPPCGLVGGPFYNDAACQAVYPNSVYDNFYLSYGCACPFGYNWNSTGTACVYVGPSSGTSICSTNVCLSRYNAQACSAFTTFRNQCTLKPDESLVCVDAFNTGYSTVCTSDTDCTGGQVCAKDPTGDTYYCFGSVA